mmetsp:Transcript_14992/g.52160  ORF Transcript_14992/g.52160 Transcript_14992/m.52160 type:complete len:285 (+) Transcript_14992:817-1671(+)
MAKCNDDAWGLEGRPPAPPLRSASSLDSPSSMRAASSLRRSSTVASTLVAAIRVGVLPSSTLRIDERTTGIEDVATRASLPWAAATCDAVAVPDGSSNLVSLLSSMSTATVLRSSESASVNLTRTNVGREDADPTAKTTSSAPRPPTAATNLAARIRPGPLPRTEMRVCESSRVTGSAEGSRHTIADPSTSVTTTSCSSSPGTPSQSRTSMERALDRQGKEAEGAESSATTLQARTSRSAAAVIRTRPFGENCAQRAGLACPGYRASRLPDASSTRTAAFATAS